MHAKHFQLLFKCAYTLLFLFILTLGSPYLPSRACRKQRGPNSHGVLLFGSAPSMGKEGSASLGERQPQCRGCYASGAFPGKIRAESPFLRCGTGLRRARWSLCGPAGPHPLLGVALWGHLLTGCHPKVTRSFTAGERDGGGRGVPLDLVLRRLPASTSFSPPLLPKGSRRCRAASRSTPPRLGCHSEGSGAQELPPRLPCYSRPMESEGWITPLASAAPRKHGGLGCPLGFPVRLAGSRAHAQRGDRGLWLCVIQTSSQRGDGKPRGLLQGASVCCVGGEA